MFFIWASRRGRRVGIPADRRRAYRIRPYTPASPSHLPPPAPSGYPFQCFFCQEVSAKTSNNEPPQQLVGQRILCNKAKKTFPLLSLSRCPHRNGVCVCQNLHRRPFSPHRVPPLTGARGKPDGHLSTELSPLPGRGGNRMGTLYQAVAPAGAREKQDGTLFYRASAPTGALRRR